MPQIETVHVKKTLSGVAVAYFQQPGVFIAQKVAPFARVAHKSDYYFIYGMEHFDVVDAVRRPGTTPVAVEHTVSTDQYVCDEYSMREKVTDEEVEEADDPLEPQADATNYVSERLALSHEYRIATQLRDITNYQTNFTVTLTDGDQWNEGTSSEPIQDMQTAIDAIVARGVMPNTMWMGYPVWSQGIAHHPDFVNRLQSNNPQVVTAQLLMTLFPGIDTVALGSAVYNTAEEGQPQDLGFVWGRDFGVAYVNRTMPRKKAPSYCYSFLWPYSVTAGRIRRTNQPGARNGAPFQARTYRHADEGAKSDWVEVAYRTGFKIVGPYMGYLIKDAVAA